MNPFSPNWPLLKELRAKFLSETLSTGSDYWTSSEWLVQYHHSFGERVAWKWAAVLNELKQRQFNVGSDLRLYDFACGTGIATRSWFRALPSTTTRETLLFDRSRQAMAFAQEQLRREGIVTEVTTTKPGPSDFVLLSHLASELTSRNLNEVVAQLKQSAGFVWVEPGTPAASATLVEVRKQFLASGDFCVIAPCPDANQCPLAEQAQPRDWCHFFAPVPNAVFHDRFWSLFSRELKIDLRSLPVSFLCLSRRPIGENALPGRVIGRPRLEKGRARALICANGKLSEQNYLRKKHQDWISTIEQDPFFAIPPDHLPPDTPGRKAN